MKGEKSSKRLKSHREICQTIDATIRSTLQPLTQICRHRNYPLLRKEDSQVGIAFIFDSFL